MIDHVAILQPSGLLFSLPKPNRHGDVIRYMVDLGEQPPISGYQGFLDEQGYFIDRETAAQIAVKTGQVEKLTAPPYLYSEDLW